MNKKEKLLHSLNDGLKKLFKLDEMSIQKLPDLIIAQIAAGEVIESPAAVIKELIENSIDAGARKIEILIKDTGMTHLQVRDDGSGISREDLPLALASFATSKIRNSDDLFQIHTMGFRGEALSSIRSVAHISIDSRTAAEEHSWKISGEGDYISEPEISGLPAGTKIDVENLFYNVPIRKKFIGGENKIRQSIIELITAYAIINHSITFFCIIDDKIVINLKSCNTMSLRLEQIYGDKFMANLTPLYNEEPSIKLQGYLSGSGFHHSRPVFIKFFVNKRPVTYSPLIRILKKVYGELLPPGKFPAAFLFMDIDPEIIDVNVHPQKKEIRFKDDNEISTILYESFHRSIENKGSLNLNRKLLSNSSFGNKSRETAEYRNLDFDNPIQVNDNPQEIFGLPQSSQVSLNERIEIRPEIVHTRLFNTFILATSSDGVFLIDQHTAHERIQYEKYLDKISTNQPIQQLLLDPVTMELSKSEKDIISAHRKELSLLGFDMEDFGPVGIKISATPSYLVKGEETEAIKIILQMIVSDEPMRTDTIFQKMAKSLACRSALKKGENASLHDSTELITKLYECKNPLRCPHGRPTIVHLSQNDIYRLFNRPVQ